MAKHLLNDTALRAIKPTDKDQLISDGSGLFLLVKPDGKKMVALCLYLRRKTKSFIAWGLSPNNIVSRKEAASNGEIAHYLCAHCFDNNKKSILQITQPPPKGWAHIMCPCCKTDVPTGYRSVGEPQYI